MTGKFSAGSGVVEITPADSQFLFGYPHVERYSTGVHDSLFSTALCLSSKGIKQLIISNDVIFVSKPSVARIRRNLFAQTGIPEEYILISATHTHSGPLTMDYISNANDPVVPEADRNFISFMEDKIVEAGLQAVANLEPAEIGLMVADGTGIGTNRRNPEGPADMDVPVLAVRHTETRKMMAVMLVCSMHPTVLHEDSKLISGDFPAMAREYLQHRLGVDCAVVYHTGCEGNQSPRHVTKENTFAEAERLGGVLGTAVMKVLPDIVYQDEIDLAADRAFTDLPGREFPDTADAERRLETALSTLTLLRESGASPQKIRTAECDWFGAEETLTLSKAQSSGQVEEARRSCMPFEIQLMKIGPWTFAAWPGEMFVEYGLEIRKAFRNTFVINLANGELQGYIVTEEAAEEGGYEASNGLFSHTSGPIIVEKTRQLLKESGMEVNG
jgi:neutral ceramidase